jgi:tetratricopeptide (TPR) repeat protein
MPAANTASRPAPRALALLLCFALLLLAAGASAQRKPTKEEQKAAASVAPSKRVADKLMKANEFLEADKLDEALAVIDGMVGKRSNSPADNAQIHRFRGYILMSKGQLEKAAPEFEKSLEQLALDPSSEQQMMYSLAGVYTQLGKYAQALEVINRWFEGATEVKPDAYFLKAMILVQQEKFKEALEPARTAVDLAEKPRESWVQLLISVYSQLQDYPKVADTLELLIGISPKKKQYWVQLAAVQNVLEREARALATLRLAHEGDLLTDDREYRQLARLLFLRDLPYQCAKIIEEGLAKEAVKADADAYRLMSNCFIAAREHDLALEPLAKAGELAPDGEMYMLLGQMHLQRDRFEPALDALRKAFAKAKPEQRGPVQLMMGVAQLGADRLDEAERAFAAAANDKKVHDAAQSYLKFLGEERMRREQRELLRQQAAEAATAEG